MSEDNISAITLDGGKPRRWSPRRLAVLLVLILIVGGGAALATSIAEAGGAHSPEEVTVSATACAPGWVAPRSGNRTFRVRNTSRAIVYGIDLVGANEATIYGEIEMLAPGTVVPMSAVLPPGRYSFQCEAFDGNTLTSEVERVTGHPLTDAHPYTPIDSSQIQAAELTYRNSLLPVMRQLEIAADALRAAIVAGDLRRARSLWLPAHLDYSRLGAAYDTFGKFNAEINGRPFGLVGGIRSPQFHGFLRLEYGLWHHQPVSELIPVANALELAVHGLAKQFPTMLMPLNDLALRTHEILENTLQFELTGETDEGSNTNLATAWANAQGTALALHAIAPLLRLDDARLVAQLSAGLGTVTAEFKSYERPNGSWTPLDSLTTAERQRIDGSLGALLEQLSLVPDLLDLPIRPDDPND